MSHFHREFNVSVVNFKKMRSNGPFWLEKEMHIESN